MRSLDDWLEHIERLHPSTIDLTLERVEAVRAALALHFAVPVVTVAGTNGKGSVCGFIEAILRAAGYRVGLYTSPHLTRYNERVRIDGAEASDAALIAAFERVERARGDIRLTYFEFGTLAAALAFAAAKLDALVLEVGLGGRLDAVNVFEPDCAIVTTVALDHMNYLGDTREAIGREKAGVYRPGKPAICGDPEPPASLVTHADAIGARLLRLGREFGYEPGKDHWRYWGPRGKRAGLPHPALRGAHQLANAAVALAALGELHTRIPVDMQAVRSGLVEVGVPARYQVLPGRPVVVLDVAHNPHAARALSRTLRAHAGHARTLAVFAMLADKDIGAVIEAVRSEIHGWYVAPLSVTRAARLDRLRQELDARDPGKPVASFESVTAAYRAAVEAASADDRIVVFGSFHTVADVAAALQRGRAPTP